MASASSLLSEDHCLCCICMEVFTDPVTTPCGHNYRKACIIHYWDTSDVCKCLLCAKIFDKRPDVSVNTFISEMVQQFRSHKLTEEYEAKTEAEVQQMIQERQVKIQEVKRSVELSKKDADTVIAVSLQAFTALISCIERSQAELIDVTEEKQKATEKQGEGFIEDLKHKLNQLEKRSSELKQLSHTENHLHPLQNFKSNNTGWRPTKDWTKVNVHQSSLVGTVSQLETTLSQEMKKLYDVELRRIRQYEVDVILDPDTALPCPILILSMDGRQVSCGIVSNNIYAEVSGKQSFSGRFYYEVQVTGKAAWTLGLASESKLSNHCRHIRERNPNNGYWTIGMRNGHEYFAHAGSPVLLLVREEVQKVGVFVDYDEGLVSFNDVETKVHLYSFTGCTFTEKVLPFFSICNYRGRNSASLIISPVNMDTELGEDDENMFPPSSKRRKT